MYYLCINKTHLGHKPNKDIKMNIYMMQAEKYKKIRDAYAGTGDASGYNRYDGLYEQFHQIAIDVDNEKKSARGVVND